MRLILALILVATMAGGASGDSNWSANGPHIDRNLFDGKKYTYEGEKWVMVEMDQFNELIEAARGVLQCLIAPTDRYQNPMTVTLEYREPLTEQQLADMRVEDLKRKDAAIQRFRDALKKVE